jgi:cell division protein FtsW
VSDPARRTRRGAASSHLRAVAHPEAPGGSGGAAVVAPAPNGARRHLRRLRPAGEAPAPLLGAGSTYFLLVVVVSVLVLIGLVMVLSASSVVALRQDDSAWYYFVRQAVWVAVGGLTMLATSRVDYRRWRRVSVPFLVLCTGLLVAVLVPGVGVVSGGSSRWIGAGQLRLQPSELMKLALVVFVADLLSRRAERIREWRATLRPVLIVLCLTVVLVLKQPDMGTALVLVCIAFALLFAAGMPLRTMGGLSLATVGGAFAVGLAEPYRRARLLSFLNPFAHKSGSGYQVVQSLVGLGSGGILGVGLGASRAKWGFLPNSYTDFIFAIIGEELGLLGSLLVVGLFAVLALLGIRVAARCEDRFGSLLAAGITCWMLSQAIINIGAVVGVLPVTGVPLPFVSFGGSSLVILLGATGILLNIAGQERSREAA